ncbi:hypothetical protein R1flu_004871 [Riccia fluitans]|uniref:Uncharacterized protein n=1 Tax=Riccia fluitans TaxID=41844 RepID=A0ABD1YRI4_9MARC
MGGGLVPLCFASPRHCGPSVVARESEEERLHAFASPTQHHGSLAEKEEEEEENKVVFERKAKPPSDRSNERASTRAIEERYRTRSSGAVARDLIASWDIVLRDANTGRESVDLKSED